MILTQEQIELKLQKLSCCSADLAFKAYKAAQSQSKDTNCWFSKFQYVNRAVNTLTGYIPPGTATITSVDACATIDFSSLDISLLGDSMVIQVDYQGPTAQLIATITGDFTGFTLVQFLQELVDEINSQSTFTASRTTTELIICVPTDIGEDPLGSDITVTFSPFFMKDTGVETNSNPRNSCNVNNPSSVVYGYTFIPNYNTDTVGVYDYDVHITDIDISGQGTAPNDCCYDPINDRIYVPCVGTSNVIIINSDLSLGTALVTGASTSACIYNPINNCKYVTVSGTNAVIKLDTSDTPTTITGFNSPAFLEVNTYTGEVWVGSSSINSFWIIDPTTNATTTFIGPTIGANFSFYPGANPSAARMLINDYFNLQIESWFTTGIIDNQNFIVLASNPTCVHYSILFNKVFVGLGSGLNIYNINGTPNSVPVVVGTPAPAASNNFGDDFAHNAVFRIVNPSGADDLEFYILNTIESTYTGEFDGTITETVSTDQDNCLKYDPNVLNILEIADGLCCSCCSNNEDLILDTL